MWEKGRKDKIREKKNGSHWNTLYRIQFNGKKNLLIFRDIIAFINPKHEKKFKTYKKMAMA